MQLACSYFNQQSCSSTTAYGPFSKSLKGHPCLDETKHCLLCSHFYCNRQTRLLMHNLSRLNRTMLRNQKSLDIMNEGRPNKRPMKGKSTICMCRQAHKRIYEVSSLEYDDEGFSSGRSLMELSKKKRPQADPISISS